MSALCRLDVFAAVQYTRAVTAAKLERMFAKPFIAALEGHSDGVYTMSGSPTNLVAMVSGAGDGEVRVWDIAHRKTMWSTFAHDSIVRGVSVAFDGASFVTCGDDKNIHQYGMHWSTGLGTADDADDARDRASAAAASSSSSSTAAMLRGQAAATRSVRPLNSWSVRYPLTSCDCRRSDETFATSGGSMVELWSPHRSEPIQRMTWGADTVTTVRWNPAESFLLASAGSDRAVTLYDTRAATPLRKVVMSMQTNQIDWNPREPLNFTIANEDHNLYTFDMRRLNAAMMVHRDFVAAVMCVRYSPTGREFIAGGYDRTMRIFPVREGKSRDAYHTKRMQRIFAVHVSGDAKYALTGSDDTNVRVWRMRASESLARPSPRERAATEYREALKKRFAHTPEVSRILRQRRTPQVIRKAIKRKREADDIEDRRRENVRRHSKPGTVAHPSVRAKRVVGVKE